LTSANISGLLIRVREKRIKDDFYLVETVREHGGASPTFATGPSGTGF
jgi:hypothetical protein